MTDEPSLFEQAADVLREAIGTIAIGKQSLLLDEALRLNRLANEQARARTGQRTKDSSKPDP